MPDRARPEPVSNRLRRAPREKGRSATAGSDAERRGPVRRCIVTGATGDPADLLRFVVGPDGDIVPDLDRRLPGRGIWVAARRDALEKAVAKQLFQRAARQKVTVPSDLVGRLERMIADRLIESLGLARRAGAAVTGFEKVSAWVRGGRAGLVAVARDAADGGRTKMQRLAAATNRELPVIGVLDAEELGRPFGRPMAVHVALARGALADRAERLADWLAGWRQPAVAGSEALDGPGRE